jgi:hypothetical protein
MRTEYAAPTGLKFALVLFYKYVAPMALWLTARSGRTQGPGQKANGQRMAGPGPDWPALPELGRAQT